MIISPHLIVGAAIGAKTHNFGLIILFSLLGHWIMDLIPHWDYTATEGISQFNKTKKIKYLLMPFIKMSLDILLGLVVIVIVVIIKKSYDMELLKRIFYGMFFSILPDIAIGIISFFVKDDNKNSFSKKYLAFHCKYLHNQTEKEGKITFLGFFTQIIVIIGVLIGFFV